MTNVSNLFAFETPNQLCAFIEQIKSLREVVRCPICKEFVENPLCASCNHIFCSKCKNNKCPICKSIIKEIPIKNYIKSLLGWLRKVDFQLKSTFNCDVFNLNYEDITLIFDKNFLKEIVESTSSESTFDKLIDSETLKHSKRKSVKKYTKKGDNKLNSESFVKVELKQDILKWLESTKNNFNQLLSQSQCDTNEELDDFLHLPSISQNKGTIGRSRSFEIKSKGHAMVLRRRSNQELKCKDKEEVVRLMEEECLDRIEMDLNQNMGSNKGSESGWKRMRKMSKVANKSKGKLRELNVTLTSPTDNKENVNNNRVDKMSKCLNVNHKKKRKLNDSDDLCKVELNDQNTQTSFLGVNMSVQTEFVKEMRDFGTQTDSNEFNQENKSIQTCELDEYVLIHKNVLTHKNDSISKNDSILKNISPNKTQIDNDDDIFEMKTQPIIIKDVPKKIDDKSVVNSGLTISLTNPKINSKEECEQHIANMLKNYNVEFDNENDNQNKLLTNHKSNKSKNKYIMNDLSIEVMSENVDSSKSDENLTLKDSNKVDYDRYLRNVMKKYEKNVNNAPSTSKKKTESQNVYERCEAMIKSIVNTSQKEIKFQSSNKENVETTDLEMIEEFSKAFTTPKTGVNKTQNDRDVLPSTEAMMEDVDVEELERCFDLKENDRSHVVLDWGQVVEKNGSKGVDEEVMKESCNVIILQNVLMKKGRKSETVVVEEDCASAHSEDLFNNTDDEVQIVDDDEDVVQESPKKVSRGGLERSIRQQFLKNKETKLPSPINSPNLIPSSLDLKSFLNKTFTPPIDFQDAAKSVKDVTNLVINDSNSNSNSEDDITLIPNEKVTKNKEDNDVIDLCSINLKDFDEPMSLPKTRDKNTSKNDDLNLSISESEVLKLVEPQSTNFQFSQHVITSTQNSAKKKIFESLEISPIRSEKRKRNSLDLINKSKCSPLTIVVSQKRKENSIPENRFLSLRKQKSILSFVKPDKIDKNATIVSIGSSPSSSLTPTPYVCFTRLNREQSKVVFELTKKRLIKYSNNFTPNITHIVCMTNENNYIHDHTMKLLKAIAYGKWVVNLKWVQDCLKQEKIIAEEDYEALDMSGEPGPKNSRLHLNEKLLKGFKIYLEPPFSSASNEEVEELITVLGGEVLTSLQDLFGEEGIRLIVAESNGTQDDYKFEEWSKKYNVFVVDVEWLSRSIGQYKLLSLRPFGLCSEDNIFQMGYPRSLTIEASFSYTQNTVAIN